jgi:ABC-type uncharacterized transport system involved in gliding motility auxiliary subunit
MIVRVALVALWVGSSSCADRPPSGAPPTTVTTGAELRADTAREPAYALTAGSTRILGTLTSEFRIDAYFASGVPELDRFVNELRHLLAEYERQGKGKLRVRLIEANSHELREQAKANGLHEQPFSERDAVAARRPTIAQGYLGLVFEYGGQKAAIPMLPLDTRGLEFWISNKIRETRDKAHGIKHRIGVVTAKAELQLTDAHLITRQGTGGGPTLKGIMEQAFPFYQLETVELRDGANAIDPSLVGLIVTQPQQDYVEPELRRIDEFLMLGGKALVVYASAVNLKAHDPSFVATLSTRGLEALLDGYGLHLNRDAVFDHGSQFLVQVTTQSGSQAAIRHPGMALVLGDPATPEREQLLDVGFAAFFRMDAVIFPFPSSVELLRYKQPASVLLQAVARSTPQSSVETSATVDMKLREHWTPTPPLRQRILAAYAEGRLQSAFAGKPPPNMSQPARASRSSRVLLVSSSLILTNPFAYAGNGVGAGSDDLQLAMFAQPYTKHLTSTIISLKNTLDWMIGDDDLAAASAKLVGHAHEK